MSKFEVQDDFPFVLHRSTAELESFHSHVLMYAPKGISFSSPVYEARVLLAGLDYNHHVHRPAMKSKDGALVYVTPGYLTQPLTYKYS